jgi:glycosyltransferase involved in cell wall biosynthesis
VLAPTSHPLVSIIVPVYKTAAYLHECLESIQAQTYPHWEAVVGDNCSPDGAGEIAESFARRDPRFRVFRHREFVGQSDNYNRGIAHRSPEARYVKFVESDNWIYPECLARMVALAERYPRVGLVSSYYLNGARVDGSALPYHREVVAGRELARGHLLEPIYLFGTPTQLLFRREALEGLEPWFDPAAWHDDVDLCFRILERWDFGFVHQVLSFWRKDNAGVTDSVSTFNPSLLLGVILARKFGPRFLEPGEAEELNRFYERRYRLFLGKSLWKRRSPAFWDFHRRGMAQAGMQLSRLDLYGAAVIGLIMTLFRPFTRPAGLRPGGSGVIKTA